MKILTILALFCIGFHSYAEEKAISARKVGIRMKPSILSRPTHFFSYGDTVKIIEKKASWAQVEKGKNKGWLPLSSLDKPRSILEDIGKGELEAKKVDRDEIASAAKGFSEEFEKLSAKKNPKLNFKDVDQIEKMTTDFDLSLFSKKGQLMSEAL